MWDNWDQKETLNWYSERISEAYDRETDATASANAYRLEMLKCSANKDYCKPKSLDPVRYEGAVFNPAYPPQMYFIPAWDPRAGGSVIAKIK